MVYQVPIPEPLALDRTPGDRDQKDARLGGIRGHARASFTRTSPRQGRIATSFDSYPVRVNGRYMMAPSPIPKFDNPKMHHVPRVAAFWERDERKRIYAVPPFTKVKSLDFEDYPFEVPEMGRNPAAICGCRGTAFWTR